MRINLFFVCCATLAVHVLVSCNNKEADFLGVCEDSPCETLSVSEKETEGQFEQQFMERSLRQTRVSDDGLVLIGYKSVYYHGDDSVFVNKLWSDYRDEIESTGYTLTLDGKARIYFCLKDAIVMIDGKKYVADSMGVVHGAAWSEKSKIRVMGCEKSRYSIRTKFAKEYRPKQICSNWSAAIFDLGERVSCCVRKKMFRKTITVSEDTPGTGETYVPCVKNHPGYPNCSKAFNITTERCEFKSDRCMDYNGYGTDCTGSHLYFVGSDCSIAVARFHCWNEDMQ